MHGFIALLSNAHGTVSVMTVEILIPKQVIISHKSWHVSTLSAVTYSNFCLLL